ncbi:MAG: hypothetical protein FJW61_01850 [Actinobacteria bacterium]|nr:hypothetical protein [Actinomycetota bacterium]
MKIYAKWLRLSEEINAIDYLYRANCFIKQTEKDKTAWKWVVISLFGALYGFAICALKGTASFNVIEKKEWGDILISFDEAIKRCQDPRFMNMTVMSKCLILTNEQKESIRKLKNVLRNKFEHFIPTSWSIEIHGLPEISLNILEIINFLALEAGNYTYLKDSQKRKIKSYIYQSRKALKQSKIYKEIKSINKK